MTNNKKFNSGIKNAPIKFAVLLLTLLVVIASAFTGFTTISAAEEESQQPIRSVHKVKVGDKSYCCFVENNVVLTPEEIEKITQDEEDEQGKNEALISKILELSGFYMKEPNCNEPSHSAITVKDWGESGGSILFYEEDILNIRNAIPENDSSVKFYMDIMLSTKDMPEDAELPSTYTPISPGLLFVVVATKEDKENSDYKKQEKCDPVKKEEKEEESAPAVTEQPQPAAPVKKPAVPKVAPVPEETLPEFKTIKMLDRSGGPLEETLKEGDPVTLEWRNPKGDASGKKSSFLNHIPGGILSLAALAVGAAIAVFAILRRRKEKEEDEE